MRRISKAHPHLVLRAALRPTLPAVLGASVLLLSACGLVGSEQEDAVAGLSEESSFTPAEEQSSLPDAATADLEPQSETTVGVLRVAVPAEESGADTSPSEPEPDTDSSTSSSTPSTAADQPPESSSTTAAAATPTTLATTPSTAISTTTATTLAPTTSAAPTTSTAPTTAAPTTQSTTTTAKPTNPGSGLRYKGILAAGDNEITAFDNARKTIKGMFTADGVQAANLIELSRQSSEQTNGVRATSVAGIEQAMADLNVGDGDACIVFLTSHGNRQTWFVRGTSGLTPDKLDQILDASCGNRPTVALVSACYSGIFIGPLAQSNRVVLTAASATNTSFGCSPEATYTYWDGCLITHFAQASTWEDLYRRVTGCIEGKEAAAGVTPSRPQAHFGSDVANLPILNR